VSVIIEEMENDVEREEIEKKEDRLEIRPSCPSGELGLSLFDPEIAAEINKPDNFRSDYDQVRTVT
jgi:hypothetical protein